VNPSTGDIVNVDKEHPPPEGYTERLAVGEIIVIKGAPFRLHSIEAARNELVLRAAKDRQDLSTPGTPNRHERRAKAKEMRKALKRIGPNATKRLGGD
jgi:hypothetical protein